MLKADLILHPVRMRMIIVLSGRQLTPKQLATELKDVASATLYHHLNLLTEAGITRVSKSALCAARCAKRSMHSRMSRLS